MFARVLGSRGEEIELGGWVKREEEEERNVRSNCGERDSSQRLLRNAVNG